MKPPTAPESGKPLVAVIHVPLATMLPADVFTDLLSYAEQKRVEVSDVLVDALKAFHPRMAADLAADKDLPCPAPPAGLAMAG